MPGVPCSTTHRGAGTRQCVDEKSQPGSYRGAEAAGERSHLPCLWMPGAFFFFWGGAILIFSLFMYLSVIDRSSHLGPSQPQAELNVCSGDSHPNHLGCMPCSLCWTEHKLLKQLWGPLSVTDSGPLCSWTLTWLPRWREPPGVLMGASRAESHSQ